MKIPLQRIDWGPTIKLALVRSWVAGFVLVMLVLVIGTASLDEMPHLILTIVLYPIVSIVAGLIFYLLSHLPMGWGFALMGTLLFCWGDPILYILVKKIRAFNEFNNYDLKLINFRPFIVLEKQEGRV